MKFRYSPRLNRSFLYGFDGWIPKIKIAKYVQSLWLDWFMDKYISRAETLIIDHGDTIVVNLVEAVECLSEYARVEVQQRVMDTFNLLDYDNIVSARTMLLEFLVNRYGDVIYLSLHNGLSTVVYRNPSIEEMIGYEAAQSMRSNKHTYPNPRLTMDGAPLPFIKTQLRMPANQFDPLIRNTITKPEYKNI